MTHNAVKYYSGSRMDCPCWKTSPFTDSHCSITGPALPTHSHTQLRVCHFKHWCTVLKYCKPLHTAASGAQKQVYRNWWKIIKWTKEAVSLKCYHLMYVCVRVLDISSKIRVGAVQVMQMVKNKCLWKPKIILGYIKLLFRLIPLRCRSILPKINGKYAFLYVYADLTHIPKTSLSGGNYNVAIRDKVCCSQLELGFNWAAVIGLLHLKVEFNTMANFCCEVTKWNLKCGI